MFIVYLLTVLFPAVGKSIDIACLGPGISVRNNFLVKDVFNAGCPKGNKSINYFNVVFLWLVIFLPYNVKALFICLCFYLVYQRAALWLLLGLPSCLLGASSLQYYGPRCYIHMWHFVNQLISVGKSAVVMLNAGTGKLLRGEFY